MGLVFYHGRSKQKPVYALEKIMLESLWLPYVGLGIGVLLALVAFMAELLLKRRDRKGKHRKLSKSCTITK